MQERPQIVVLDGHTTTADDVNFAALESLGSLTVYPRTSQAELVARAHTAHVLLTNKVRLDAEAFRSLPKLKFISVLATGTNVIDLEAARSAGVVVSNVPAYSTASTAQAAIALMLELAFHAGEHSASVHRGQWSESPDFSYTVAPLLELDKKVLGIVGMGMIGSRVARIAQALGMRVIASSRTEKEIADVRWVALDALFVEADVISLHCPLTDATRHLVNRERLASMKRSALLINTGRGPLIDEAALAEALNQDLIAGAAVDVLSEEPPPKDCPLLGAKHCIITPHIAWASSAARQRLVDVSVKNVEAYLNARPINVVS